MIIRTEKLLTMVDALKATSGRSDIELVRFSIRPGRLTMVWRSSKGSAGYFAEAEAQVPDYGLDFGVNVKSLVESLKPFKGNTGDCEIVLNIDGAEFTIGGTKFKHFITPPPDHLMVDLDETLFQPLVFLPYAVIKPFKKALSVVDPRDVRVALTGVMVRLFGDKAIFVGTNGVKLVETTTPINADVLPETRLIIRHEQGNGLVKCAPLFKGSQIKIKTRENSDALLITLETQYGEVKLNILSKKIADSYPDYEGLFTNLTNMVGLAKNRLVNMVDGAAYDLDPCDNNRLQLLIYDTKLLVGTEKITMDCQLYTSDMSLELDNHINGKFLRDVLGVLSADKINLRWNPEHNFITFEPETSELESERVLITTLRKRQ